MKVLLDSDYLFGLFVTGDPNHEKAKKLHGYLFKNNVQLQALNCVIQETATVLSNKISHKDAKAFLESYQDYIDYIILLDENLESLAWGRFQKQTKSHTSFVDCANLATYYEYKLDKIVSFDKFYPKEVLLLLK